MVTSDWAPVVAAGIGALAGLGGQWIAGQVHARNQERAERREERLEGQRRRERAAQVLADVTVLLVDAEAIRISGTILAGVARREMLLDVQGNLAARYGQLRGQLMALATGHPSAEARKLARELEAPWVATYTPSGWPSPPVHRPA